MVGVSARLCHSQKELGGLRRGRLDGRLWRWPARTGENVAATVTHHSDVPVTLPNIATSVRLVQHGEGEETEHKTRSIVLLRVVVGGFHVTKTTRPTTTSWVGRAVAL